MKNSHLLYILIFIVFYYSCTPYSKKEEIIDRMLSIIEENVDEQLIEDNEKQVFLFIADEMCSECIIKEFQNIKSESITVNVIGYFKDRRNFVSSTNRDFIMNRIFIDRNRLDGYRLPVQPVYFIYNKNTNTISDIFYPLPTEEAKTFSYFQKIKDKMIQNE